MDMPHGIHHSFSDQLADKLYQKVIDIENNNGSPTNLPDSSTVKDNQNNSNLSSYDPSDLLANNLKGTGTFIILYLNMPISIIQFLPTLIPTIVKLCLVK
jgi:hypothetical protein